MIHPTALIDPTATLADDVSVGAYSIIEAEVSIGAGCEIGPHVVIKGPTTIGENNKIYQFSSIGEAPQDKKYGDGEPTTLEIGDGNLIREHVTINRGTVQGGGVTKVGNDNWIMAYVHIAHDCIIGDHIIMANNTTLAGHVIIEDHVILGGFTLVSQFNRIGVHAFTSMGSVVASHIPPYVLVSGHMATPKAINTEGLKRRGFSSEQISLLRQAYKLIYRQGLSVAEAVERIRALSDDEELEPLIAFLTENSGIIR